MDSFGLNCPKNVIKVSNTLNLNYVYNSTQYQDFSVSYVDVIVCIT